MMHHFVLWRLLIVGAVALTESASDIYAPAQSSLQRYFCCSCSMVSLTMSANLVGMAIASLLFGAMCDYTGRKRSLIAALSLFGFASWAAMFASSIEELIVWRFLQGMGGGGAPVCAYSLISDAFKGKERARELSLLSMFTAVVPAIAPIFGSLLLLYFSWRAIFLMLAVISVIWVGMLHFFFEEKYQAAGSSPVVFLRSIGRVYRELISVTTFRKQLLVLSIVMGLLWVEIAHFPFVLMDSLEINPALFSVMLSVSVCTYILFCRVNQHLVMRYRLSLLITLGVVCFFLSWVLLALSLQVTHYHPLPSYLMAWLIIVVKLPAVAGFSFLLSNLSALLLSYRPGDFGVLSSMITFSHMILGSILIYLMGLVYNHTFYPLFVLQGSSLVLILLLLFNEIKQSAVFLRKKYRA